MKRDVPQDMLDEELKIRERMQKLQNAEHYVKPNETLEERISKIKDIYREGYKVARTFGMDARAIYTLFFSPPHIGAAAQ